MNAEAWEAYYDGHTDALTRADVLAALATLEREPSAYDSAPDQDWES